MMLYFFMLPTSLVRMENGFCEASSLEQREAQNNRVRCHREQSRMNVVCDDHAAVSYTHLTSDFTSDPLVGKFGVRQIQLDADEMTPHL